MTEEKQRVFFKIEYVKEGFHPFAECVALDFAKNEPTYPKPKDKRCMQVLQEQHPELYETIPVHHEEKGFKWVCGLCFTVVGRTTITALPVTTKDQIHPHSFFSEQLEEQVK